jgi:fructose-1,6-bisphosphatase II
LTLVSKIGKDDEMELEKEFLKVTEAAAMASSKWVGKGDRHAADDAATKAMREKFNSIDFDGTVVIGEGERDKAPMLYIGEKLGTGKGQGMDIAVDPLDGTNLAAAGKNGAICVLSAAPRGSLFHAPDMYMEKIAVGPKIGRAVSLSKSIEENIKAIAKKLDKPVGEVTVVTLDRPRHAEIISKTIAIGAKVKLIQEGDIFGAVNTAFEQCGVDMLVGTGAAPEGVVAATALKILGGYFEGRLKFKDDGEKERAKKMGITDFEKTYTIDELVKGNEGIFVATGVTDGELLKGVRKEAGKYATHSLIISSRTGSAEFVESTHEA